MSTPALFEIRNRKSHYHKKCNITTALRNEAFPAKRHVQLENVDFKHCAAQTRSLLLSNEDIHEQSKIEA